MLGNIFTELRSNNIYPQKGSMCTSNMHTTITTQYENISFENYTNEQTINQSQNQIENQLHTTNFIPMNEGINYRKGREYFQNSLCFKLHELEEKSSKIISKLPSIHGKILKAQNYSKNHIQHPFLSTSSIYGNKLKIIRDLQQKIVQLETNINNPLTCHEYMRNIEKQINLNFQNYYQQIKDNNQIQKQNESICSQDSIDIKQSKQKNQNKQEETQTTKFIQKKTNQIQIYVYIPKIIQIEVPCEIIKPKMIQGGSERQSSSESEPLSINSNPNYNKNSKQSQQSSIQRIINQYNGRLHPNLNDENSKQAYTYRINLVDPSSSHQSIQQKQQFHLPLDSYERCQSQKGSGCKRNIQLLKKTDRSNISSSNSQIQNLRDQIWNKDELQFNHQHLSLVKQSEHKSEDHSEHNYRVQDEQRQRLLLELNHKITELTSENEYLKNRINEMTEQNNENKNELQEYENKNIEIQIEYLQQSQKIDELRQQNERLNEQIINMRQLIDRLQVSNLEIQNRIKIVNRQYDNKIQYKDQQIVDLMRIIDDKSQQIQQYMKINIQMKKIIDNNELQYNRQMNRYQILISELKQSLNFYKLKLQQQGFNFKLEQVNILRDIIQKKQQDQNQKLIIIQNKYKNKLIQLKSDKQILLNQIQQLKNKQKYSLESLQLSQDIKKQLEYKINYLLSNYHNQLYKKQQEINQLKKISTSYQQQLNYAHITSISEINHISNIQNILIKQKINQHNISNQMVQFIYILDRLLRNIKVYQYTVQREKQQKNKLSKKIANLNIFFNRQLEKYQETNIKYQKQINKLKQQLNDVNKQTKKLSRKLQVYQNKLENPKQNNQLYNIYQLQNQFLLIQNKKWANKYQKIKYYCDQLESKLVKDFLTTENHTINHINFTQEQDHFANKMNQIFTTIKDQFTKSSIFVPQESFMQSKSKIQNFQISSSVICITNKPKGFAQSSVVKALMTPLPDIPKSSPTPAASISLDKLLQKRMCTSESYKIKVALKLIQLGIELNKFSKKLFSLKPSQILVNYSKGQVEIILRKQFGNSSEQQQNSLMYRAPQVLLGFNESQSSYVWTIGLIIDQIYHQKLYYKKINDIVSRKDNYTVRNPEIKLKDILQKMLVKQNKDRPSLIEIKQLLLLIL